MSETKRKCNIVAIIMSETKRKCNIVGCNKDAENICRGEICSIQYCPEHAEIYFVEVALDAKLKAEEDI